MKEVVIAISPYVSKVYGGDDGARTRDLCRDSEFETRNVLKQQRNGWLFWRYWKHLGTVIVSLSCPRFSNGDLCPKWAEVAGPIRIRILRLVAFASIIWDNQSEVIEMSHALLTPTLPSETDAHLAKETSRLLAPRTRSATPLSVRVGGTRNEETLQIPAPAAKMLVRILEEMALGNAVTLFQSMRN